MFYVLGKTVVEIIAFKAGLMVAHNDTETSMWSRGEAHSFSPQPHPEAGRQVVHIIATSMLQVWEVMGSADLFGVVEHCTFSCNL